MNEFRQKGSVARRGISYQVHRFYRTKNIGDPRCSASSIGPCRCRFRGRCEHCLVFARFNFWPTIFPHPISARVFHPPQYTLSVFLHLVFPPLPALLVNSLHMASTSFSTTQYGASSTGQTAATSTAQNATSSTAQAALTATTTTTAQATTSTSGQTVTIKKTFLGSGKRSPSADAALDRAALAVALYKKDVAEAQVKPTPVAVYVKLTFPLFSFSTSSSLFWGLGWGGEGYNH